MILINNLVKLQEIDSAIMAIEELQGNLPTYVEELSSTLFSAPIFALALTDLLRKAYDLSANILCSSHSRFSSATLSSFFSA